MEKVPFNDLAPTMQFGDLVLFNGKYEGSKVIEFFSRCEWSHVGMVVRLEGYEQPLIWEATSLTNIPDVIYHDNKTGVKLVDLRDRLAHYGDDLKEYETADFAYRRLDATRTDEMMKIFKELIPSMHAIPDPGFWEMTWDVIKGRFFNIAVDLNKYFCSELVAETYLKLGLLDSKRVVNSYMPVDFSDKKILDMINASLGEEILIDIQHI